MVFIIYLRIPIHCCTQCIPHYGSKYTTCVWAVINSEITSLTRNTYFSSLQWTSVVFRCTNTCASRECYKQQLWSFLISFKQYLCQLTHLLKCLAVKINHTPYKCKKLATWIKLHLIKTPILTEICKELQRSTYIYPPCLCPYYARHLNKSS